MTDQLTETDREVILKSLDEQSGGQMNDVTLNFAIEHYIQLTETEKEDIVFIDSFRLLTLVKRFCEITDEKKKLKILGIEKKLSEYKIVFFLIFNNGNRNLKSDNDENEIGHWSLLVYLQNEKEMFHHYDSLCTVNIMISMYFIKLLQNHELIKNDIIFNNPRFIIEQKQHWECAYHVLFYMWIYTKEYRTYNKKSISLIQEDILKYHMLFEVESAMQIKKTLFRIIKNTKKNYI